MKRKPTEAERRNRRPMNEQVGISSVQQGSSQMKTFFLPSTEKFLYVVKSDDDILYAGPSMDEAKSIYQNQLELRPI